MGCLMFFAFAGLFVAMGVFMSAMLAYLAVFAATTGMYMSIFAGYLVALVMILFA